MRRRARRWGLALMLGMPLAAACAAGPHVEPRQPAAVRDTVPDKIAAQRGASGSLGLEADDQRWGAEAARERRRRIDEQRAAARAGLSTDGGANAVPAAPPARGPIDLRTRP